MGSKLKKKASRLKALYKEKKKKGNKGKFSLGYMHNPVDEDNEYIPVDKKWESEWGGR